MKRKHFVIRHILFFLGVILCALTIEVLVFNFRSINPNNNFLFEYVSTSAKEYDWGRVEELDSGINIEFDKPQFIKKFQLQYDVEDHVWYKVSVKYINEFGMEIEEEPEKTDSWDIYFEELGAGFTNINKKLTEIQITTDAQWEDDFQYLKLYNNLEINQFRLLFLTIVLFLSVIFVDKKEWFISRPQWIAVIVILLIGGISIYSQGINEDGWDEEVHFMNIYNMTFWNEVETNDAIRLMDDRIMSGFYNTEEERSLSIQYLNRLYAENETSLWKNNQISYSKWLYIFQCLAIYVMRLLKAPFHIMFMGGKFANLLSYAFLVYWIIKLAPLKKTLICGMVLLPTQIFIAGTYAYDTMNFALILLGIVFWLKVLLEPRNEKTMYYILGAFLCIAVGSLAKAVYIPLLLICLCIPKEKFVSLKQNYMFKSGACLIFLMVIYTFALPAVSNTISNNVGWRGDSRGGTTDVVLQMKSVLKHPVAYVKIFLADFVESFSGFVFGLNQIANYGRLLTIDQEYGVISAIWMFFLLFANCAEEQERKMLSTGVRLIVFFTIGIVVGLIWTAMYLDYTPVGNEHINGVQARYYTALLVPLALVCDSRVIRVHIKQINYRRVMMAVPTVLALVGVYCNLLSTYCF